MKETNELRVNRLEKRIREKINYSMYIYKILADLVNENAISEEDFKDLCKNPSLISDLSKIRNIDEQRVRYILAYEAKRKEAIADIQKLRLDSEAVIGKELAKEEVAIRDLEEKIGKYNELKTNPEYSDNLDLIDLLIEKAEKEKRIHEYNNQLIRLNASDIITDDIYETVNTRDHRGTKYQIEKSKILNSINGNARELDNCKKRIEEIKTERNLQNFEEMIEKREDKMKNGMITISKDYKNAKDIIRNMLMYKSILGKNVPGLSDDDIKRYIKSYEDTISDLRKNGKLSTAELQKIYTELNKEEYIAKNVNKNATKQEEKAAEYVTKEEFNKQKEEFEKKIKDLKNEEAEEEEPKKEETEEKKTTKNKTRDDNVVVEETENEHNVEEDNSEDYDKQIEDLKKQIDELEKKKKNSNKSYVVPPIVKTSSKKSESEDNSKENKDDKSKDSDSSKKKANNKSKSSNSSKQNKENKKYKEPDVQDEDVEELDIDEEKEPKESWIKKKWNSFKAWGKRNWKKVAGVAVAAALIVTGYFIGKKNVDENEKNKIDNQTQVEETIKPENNENTNNIDKTKETKTQDNAQLTTLSNENDKSNEKVEVPATPEVEEEASKVDNRPEGDYEDVYDTDSEKKTTETVSTNFGNSPYDYNNNVYYVSNTESETFYSSEGAHEGGKIGLNPSGDTTYTAYGAHPYNGYTPSESSSNSSSTDNQNSDSNMNSESVDALAYYENQMTVNETIHKDPQASYQKAESIFGDKIETIRQTKGSDQAYVEQVIAEILYKVENPGTSSPEDMIKICTDGITATKYCNKDMHEYTHLFDQLAKEYAKEIKGAKRYSL